MSSAPPEAISPELVLVSPELRALAIDALREAENETSAPETPSPPEPEAVEAPLPRSRRRAASLTLGRVIVYAVWQTFFGALFGVAAFAAFTALVVGIALIAR